MINKVNSIRNFSIVSHIDAGKSTLADRLLELTGTIEKRKMREQYLDMMELEREKGITIKLQSVRMHYSLNTNHYTLNLIDTPGHVDFSYEVSRSLAAVEGALLLVDASQGIQAQTLANLNLAQEEKLVIIPVINKIDLKHANIEGTIGEISQLLKINPEEILKISAKEGTNVEKVLEAVIKKIPAPLDKIDLPLRALIFDSEYDAFKGVLAYVRVVEGGLKKGDKILMMASNTEVEVLETGIFRPNLTPVEKLSAGEIGYVATGLKEINKCRVGDTITKFLSNQELKVEPLVGYKEPKPMVFASFYPASGDDFRILEDALAKLKLNDAALIYALESSPALGRGFRCGFLGLLHLEIISERLRREYNLNLIITTPAVSYHFKETNPSQKNDIEEPWVKLEIISSGNYLGQVMQLLGALEGEYENTDYLTQEKVLVTYRAPLREIMVGGEGKNSGPFYDRLKSATSGYASLAYQLIGYRSADLVKLEILVAGEKVEAFSRWVSRQKSYSQAKSLAERLKEAIPRHQFAIPIQATVEGKIIARETIRPFRKDVTAKLYGGDYSRKKKLLEKQKKGKKKMKQFGQVSIPQEAFLKVLKNK